MISVQQNVRFPRKSCERFLLFISILIQIGNISGYNTPWYNWYEDNKNDRQLLDGILPTLSCPPGHYRQFKSHDLPHIPGGINLDGCLKCPKGVYGNSTDLLSSNCTAPCPKGTFNDRTGASSVDDCIPCPLGTFGDQEGLTNDQCSGRCEDIGVNSSFHWREYFGDREGLSSPDECKICPSNNDYFTCNRPDTNRLSEINDWDTNDTEQKYNFTQLAMKLQLRVLDEYQYLFSYMEVLNMLDNNTFFVSREYLDEEEPLWWCTDPECTVKPWDDVKYGYKSPVFE
jgi:hypothetical protein